jgi:glycopeptide antibiotics resistance protein
MFRVSDLFILFPLALAARVVWGVVRPAARASVGRILFDAAFMGYVVALMAVVLGFRHLGGLGADFSPGAHVNLVPLRTIGEVAEPDLAAAAVRQAVGNVLLFVPFGLLLPLTVARFRKFRSALVAGFLLSLTIEVLQLGLLLGRLMDRSADVDDVVLNTIGAVLGYAIWAMLFRKTSHPAADEGSAIEGES